jgi:hypothetical protein
MEVELLHPTPLASLRLGAKPTLRVGVLSD